MNDTQFEVRHCLTAALISWTLAAPLAAADRTSSPYEPSTPNDHTFVRNGGPNLDVSCATYEEGALTIQIPVSRFVGATNPDGTLAEPDKAIRGGTLARVAKLTIAFRQERFNTIPPFFPQRDLVSFNGTRVDQLERKNSPYLTGERDVWRVNTFVIPIGRVRFPSAKGVNGAPPIPADNSVTIDIDILNAEYEADDWCTKLDWVELEMHAASPIILIHGINSEPGFFDRHGFSTFLGGQGFVVDNTIELGPALVNTNAQILDTEFPKRVTQLGVDSVHVIAHSKGGLDARAYLTDYQPNHESDFHILSLTTLGTPHNGSVLADFISGINDQIEARRSLEFPHFPALTYLLAGMLDFAVGYRDLQPGACATFNSRNLRALPRSTTYFVAAGDADLDGNSKIDNTPDEYAALRVDSRELAEAYAKPLVGHLEARMAVDALYQILRKTPGVTVRIERRALQGGASYRVAVFESTGDDVDLANDTLVTILSAVGSGGFLSKAKPPIRFMGTMGRNHSSIADSGVSAVAGTWVIEVDTAGGDLSAEEPR